MRSLRHGSRPPGMGVNARNRHKRCGRAAFDAAKGLAYKPRQSRRLEHDPEKWLPVFRRDPAPANTPRPQGLGPHRAPQRRFSGETDLPAEQISAQAPPRLSHPHGDQGRPQGRGRAPQPRPQEAERVTRAAGVHKVIVPLRISSRALSQSRNMERLKRRTDFKAAALAAKAPTGAFVLQARLRGEDKGAVRVGFTVSRQVGTAVERNRVRRRLREMVRHAPASDFRAGHDYVLIGRRTALQASFADMARQFDAALRRVHLKSRSGQESAQERPAAEPGGGGNGAVLHRTGSPTARGRRAQHLKSHAARKDTD